MNVIFLFISPRDRSLKMNRVLRGGSWNNKPINVRCANRNNNKPDNRNNNNGFRVLSTFCRHFRF